MKKTHSKNLVLLIAFLCLSNSLFAKKNKAVNLIDKNLSHWYKWIGAPHKSVKGLPEGTPTGDGFGGVPMGLNDVKGVFTYEILNGERVLHVSGEIYGGLTSKKSYENYHLQLKYKWGTKKYAPRLKLPKDTGIMFHLTGTNEDALWSVFMMGLECQIADGSSGDLFFVKNKNSTKNPLADAKMDKNKNWNPYSPVSVQGGYNNYGSVNKSENFESDSTQWNIMDVYTIGNSAIYLVNGQVVNAFQNAGIQQPDLSIMPLTKGKIQIQSEGAEVYFKDISIQTIKDYPLELKKAAGFEGPSTWKLGVALYTFSTSTFEEQLSFAKNTGLKYVEGYSFGKSGIDLKDSLLMNLSPTGLKQVKQKIADNGLKIESIYVLGGKTIDKWKKDFELAQNLGVNYITAEPPINMLKIVDSLAGIYNIRVALHNHWKGNSQYWHPDSVLAALKNHPNLGACPDLGHYPKSGINPVDAVKKLDGKIIGIHFKDIAAYDNPKLNDVVAGTGVINFLEIFKELQRQKFAGNINIERDQKEKPNNFDSVNEIIKYYTETLNLPKIKPTPIK